MCRDVLILIVATAVAALPSTVSADPKTSLAEAMAKQDPAAIRAAVDLGRQALGDKAGAPEVADEYTPVPASAKTLTPDEARHGMTGQFARLEQMRWWKIGVDPTTLTAPLRAPGAVVGGMVAVSKAKLDGADEALPAAKDGADFLIWAQEQAGAGCYPFPAALDTLCRLCSEQFRRGKLPLGPRGWGGMLAHLGSTPQQ